MLKVSDIKLSYDDDETLEEGKKAPSWMLLLSGHCQAWLKDLPQVSFEFSASSKDRLVKIYYTKRLKLRFEKIEIQ